MTALYPGFAKAQWPRPFDPDAAAREFEALAEAAGDLAPKAKAAFARTLAGGNPALAAVFGNSPHLSASIRRDTEFALDLLAKGPDKTFAALLAGVRKPPKTPPTTEALMAALRIFKRRAGLTIALADIGGVWPLARVVEAISDTAEAALELAFAHGLREAARRDGLELADPKHPALGSGLVVLGMGKLGARELNYSSDVDLIVLYDLDRVRGVDPDDAQAAFVKLARLAVRIMEFRTDEGYVFRTDLRLRPDPASTPMAISTLAAETYYESVGQNWERAAMIKARPVAGDREAGEAFLARLRPYVWRKHLDFAAIEDIHAIKRQIQAHRGGGEIALHGHNVKTGKGGIREIEFYAQTQQLIWGGRDPDLRVKGTIAALHALAAKGHTPAADVAALEPAYAFLRTLEHRLQMVADEQTQTLPDAGPEWSRIAAFMGYADDATFERDLLGHFTTVAERYGRLFEETAKPETGPALIFGGMEDDPQTLASLGERGFAEPARISAEIRAWHQGRYRCARSTRARELLAELAPRIVDAFARTPQPDLGFVRFARFLEALPAGVQLFSLFKAQPALVELVAEIMGTAPKLAEAIAVRTHLLDAVLAGDFFAVPGEKPALRAELARANAQARDYQDRLDIARRWKHEREFRVAVQLLKGKLDARAAGAALADIADSVLASLLDDTQAEFARAHGAVPGGAYAVLALGKLGGRELTVTSDLDLVTVYSAPKGIERSDGGRPLPPSLYFNRLAQRYVSALSAATAEGGLYEVDLRLRPDGEKGPIASDIAGFAKYIRDDAWTWEHMALTRARFVCGDPALGAAALDAIAKGLAKKRDAATLAEDVAEMRARMAAERRAQTPWRIKDWRGGLVDVEFLVQHALLAAGKPALIRPGTHDAIAALAAERILPETAAATLSEAFALFSALQATLRLTWTDDFEPATAPEALKTVLARAAGAVDFAGLEAHVEAVGARVRALFQSRLPGSFPAPQRSP
ncbi:MAG: bifunctional [glutamine synthetase] adenylyltransferase/[glutamine synthetase]-adenylyl-L-tyrosine phosphorylase [Azospirillum sp.]|nr:bifunctional [glutamine synthetase] adenylyltransferase/[glutamine synthetase]-adenylyl-L-tyrosine phosphorylase [Azospirillum sp.]